MTNAQIKTALKNDYNAILSACERSHVLEALVVDAFKSAKKSQTLHDSHRPLNLRLVFSSADCARYFVIKWFREPVLSANAYDAATIRTDALLASGARIGLDQHYPGRAPIFWCSQGIDYCEHLRAT